MGLLIAHVAGFPLEEMAFGLTAIGGPLTIVARIWLASARRRRQRQFGEEGGAVR